MNYEEMTVEQLDAENQKLAGQRAAIRAEQKKLVAVRDQKVALAAAQKKLAAMSDPEKAALAQVIQAQGIESGEAVIGPNATG